MTEHDTTSTHYDALLMGRCSIDLYSQDIGAAFPDISGFSAYVGGSPTNISVGLQRLGAKTALLTGVGEDPVGDFVLHFLRKEGVETTFIPRIKGRRTSAVVLGIQPPDQFPLVFYRERCADLGLTIDDALRAPLEHCRLFQFAGTNLSQEPSRSATLFAAERARMAGAKVVLDLDFRPDQWHDPRAFGVAIRGALRLVDIVLGTEDEINAALLIDPAHITASRSISDTKVAGDADAASAALLALGPTILVQKRGAEGVRIHQRTDATAQEGLTPTPTSTQVAISSLDVPGFPVEVSNILGAGDAFASGFLYGLLQGWSLTQAARLGNACGAIVVTQHGCANFMPTYAEALAFAEQRGGL